MTSPHGDALNPNDLCFYAFVEDHTWACQQPRLGHKDYLKSWGKHRQHPFTEQPATPALEADRTLHDLLNEIEHSADGRFNRPHGGAQFGMGVNVTVHRIRAALTATPLGKPATEAVDDSAHHDGTCDCKPIAAALPELFTEPVCECRKIAYTGHSKSCPEFQQAESPDAS